MSYQRAPKAQTEIADKTTSKLEPRRSTFFTKPYGGSAVERALSLQNGIGNQAVLRLLARRRATLAESEPGRTNRDETGFSLTTPLTMRLIQPKLEIGSANDPLEHEADRVVEHVMRTPESAPFVAVTTPQVTRKCAECGEHEEKLQTKSVGPQAGGGDAPGIVEEVLRSPGQALDTATRAYFEPRFRRDFGQVRVHSGSAAEQSAREVNALAYTVGSNIVFGAGRFAPATHQGQQLIAHELTHVVQQSGPEPMMPQEETGTRDRITAAPASFVRQMVSRSPDNEKSCAINETILVYEGKPGNERCITEDDPEFQQNYVDNNIVRSTGLAIPDTHWWNIDHNRIPQMKLTYKDGRTLVLDMKDIPLVLDSSRVTRGPKAVSASRPLARYEKRSDGFIYPMRSAGKSDYVSYADANNIVSLRAGLHDEIEELKRAFSLIEAGASFAANIAALGGFASMLGHPGGLFEPVPRSKTRSRDIEEPTGPKTGRRPTKEEEHPTGKPSPEAAGASAGKATLAEIPAEGGHTVRISKGGIVEFCTECVNIGLVFRETLDQNEDLAKSFRDIQTRARQAEDQLATGNPALKAKAESQAKQAAADALRLQSKLARTGITRGGTRYRPEPDLLGEGLHGLGWKDTDAINRAKDTGNPQGKFGGLEDIQFAIEQAAQLGPGNQTPPPYIPLPPGTRSVVFMPNGTQKPATHLFVLVRQNGNVHAYPL